MEKFTTSKINTDQILSIKDHELRFILKHGSDLIYHNQPDVQRMKQELEQLTGSEFKSGYHFFVDCYRKLMEAGVDDQKRGEFWSRVSDQAVELLGKGHLGISHRLREEWGSKDELGFELTHELYKRGLEEEHASGPCTSGLHSLILLGGNLPGEWRGQAFNTLCGGLSGVHSGEGCAHFLRLIAESPASPYMSKALTVLGEGLKDTESFRVCADTLCEMHHTSRRHFSAPKQQVASGNRKITLSLLEENLDKLVENISVEENFPSAYRALSLVMRRGERKLDAVSLLEDRMDVIESCIGLGDKDSLHHVDMENAHLWTSSVLGLLFSDGGDDLRVKALKALSKGLASKKNSYAYGNKLFEAVKEEGGLRGEDAFKTLSQGLTCETTCPECAYELRRLVQADVRTQECLNHLERGLDSDSPKVVGACAKNLSEFSCEGESPPNMFYAISAFTQRLDNLIGWMSDEKARGGCSKALTVVARDAPQDSDRVKAFGCLKSGLSGDSAVECAQALALCLGRSEAELSGKALDALSDGLKGDKSNIPCLRQLAHLSHGGSEQVSEKVINRIDENRVVIDGLLADDATMDDCVKYLLGGVRNLRGAKWDVFARFFEDYASGFGLEGKRVFAAWEESGRKKLYAPLQFHKDNELTFERILTGNMKCLRELAQEGLDCVTAVSEDVLDFGRYGSKFLLRQFHERGDAESRFILAVFPYSDFNGAGYASGSSLMKLSDQAAEYGTRVRVIECDSRGDFTRKWVDKTRRKGYGDPVAVVAMAHGSTGAVQLGQDYYSGQLTLLDVRKMVGRQHGVKVVGLISCDTGVPFGIAQEISKLGVSVVAPDETTSLKDINYSEEDGEPRLKIEYTEGEALMFKDGRMVI